MLHKYYTILHKYKINHLASISTNKRKPSTQQPQQIKVARKHNTTHNNKNTTTLKTEQTTWWWCKVVEVWWQRCDEQEDVVQVACVYACEGLSEKGRASRAFSGGWWQRAHVKTEKRSLNPNPSCYFVVLKFETY